MNPTTTFILNRILSRFNLEWTDIGLRYIHKLKFGEVSYHVTSDINKVCEFLGLGKVPSGDLNELFHLVVNSYYYNIKLFPRIHGDDKSYEQFVFRLKAENFASKTVPEANVKVIDEFFGTNIHQYVNLLNSNGLNNKELRNKFNGKLVMKWAELTPGPYLAEVMDEFKEFIKDKFWIDFMEYLSTRKPKTIRADFLTYYHGIDYALANNSLPFTIR